MVWGETDYMLIVKRIKEEGNTPWRISHQVKEIQRLVANHGFTIRHCYREANKPADKLATISHVYNEDQEFTSYVSLPSQVKGLVNMDGWNILSFRIKPTKPCLIYHEPL